MPRSKSVGDLNEDDTRNQVDVPFLCLAAAESWGPSWTFPGCRSAYGGAWVPPCDVWATAMLATESRTSVSARCISGKCGGGGCYNYVQHPTPFPIAPDPLLIVLKTTLEINAGIKCRWNMKKWQFSTNIWPITAGWSRVINIWMVQ